MRYPKTSAAAAMAALLLAGGTARVGAQGQAEQFTPEYREVRRSYDEKHTPKIEAPDTVKRGQWFEVTVTVWIIAAPELSGEGSTIWPLVSGFRRSCQEVGLIGALVL